MIQVFVFLDIFFSLYIYLFLCRISFTFLDPSCILIKCWSYAAKLPAMIPYPEPYQSEFQQRRLGALGFEWRPSSLRLAVGPDFSLDPDYHMLPLADLDLLTEPLPEFIDAMEWEPEVEVFSDDTDSEYNVTEDFSSKGEKGCSSSNASGDSGCSTDNSEGEDTCMDNIRRSKRKKQKTEVSTD